MKHYQNYIFDLYGTLVDIQTDEKSIALWRNMQKIYRRYGVAFDSPQQLRQYYRTACQTGFQKACETYGTKHGEMDLVTVFEEPLRKVGNEQAHAIAITIANVFRALSTKLLERYSDTLMTLQKLQEEGCGVYLLSNAQSVFTRPELEEMELLPYLDAVYISSERGIKKPEVRFLRDLLQEQHLDPKTCVMVGNDFRSDIQIAQEAGIDSIFVNSDHYTGKQIKEMVAQMPQPDTICVIAQLQEIVGGNEVW